MKTRFLVVLAIGIIAVAAFGAGYYFDMYSSVPQLIPVDSTETSSTLSETPTKTPTEKPTKISTLTGYSRINPASMGTNLTITFTEYPNTYTADVTLLEMIRGEAAWTKVHAANMFNDPPDPGCEYILVKIRFKYLVSPEPDKTYSVSPVYFNAISETGVEYKTPSIIPPDPTLGVTIYVGASHEGWACYQVETTDAKPLLTFGRKYDGTGGIWFKLY